MTKSANSISRNKRSLNTQELVEKFQAFMKNLENMTPQEIQAIFKNAIAFMEEDGESVPFGLRLLASDVIFGLSQTPVGLAYGVSKVGQLMLTGFVCQEDIDKFGDADTTLEAIIDDFKENVAVGRAVRDDAAIGALIKSALDGAYIVRDDFFDALEATDLQRAVWQELTKIPYGETISYEELAVRVGKPKAVRAVASAVGANPISLAIPCHRAVRKDGKIGEYHWGADIKEKILAYEQANR